MSTPKLGHMDRQTLELAGAPGFPMVPTDEIRVALARLDFLEGEVERLEGLFQQTHGCHHSWVDKATRADAAIAGAEDSHRRAEEENDKLRSYLSEFLTDYVPHSPGEDEWLADFRLRVRAEFPSEFGIVTGVRPPDPDAVARILADPDCKAPTPCEMGMCDHACGCVSST